MFFCNKCKKNESYVYESLYIQNQSTVSINAYMKCGQIRKQKNASIIITFYVI